MSALSTIKKIFIAKVNIAIIIYVNLFFKTYRRNLCVIDRIKCLSATQFMVQTKSCLEIWEIIRSKTSKVAEGHIGDVIGLVIVGSNSEKHDDNQALYSKSNSNISPDELESNLRSLDTTMYSAGIDNSIRAWNINSMMCKGVFDNENRESSSSEISQLIHMNNTRLLITGHDDGKLFCWNIHNASNTPLPRAHTDSINKLYHYQHNNTEILFRFVQIVEILEIIENVENDEVRLKVVHILRLLQYLHHLLL